MLRKYSLPPTGIVLLFTVLSTIVAPAQTTDFVASINGETQTFQIKNRFVQETPYVSLTEAVRLLGGSTRLFPNSIQIGLARTSAVALFNHARVNTPEKNFSLQKPILKLDDEALISTADLPTFFSGAFQISVQEGLDSATITARETVVGVQGLDILPPASITKPITPNIFQPSQPIPPPPSTDLFDVIVIDPGHGGSDGGYEGRQGLLEKDLSLELAQEIRRALKQKTHLKSFLTRADDRSLNLRERVNIANQLQGDLIISVHAGVSTANHAKGIQIFYPKAQQQSDQAQRLASAGVSTRRASADHEARSKKFAAAVQQSIEDSRIVEIGTMRGVPLRILQDTPIPGFLIEAGFLSNPAEEALLNTEAYRQQIADAIADGILAALLPNNTLTNRP